MMSNSISRKNLKAIMKEAKRLGKGGDPSSSHQGLCSNLDAVADDMFIGSTVVMHYSPKWKHYSGNVTFPVPGVCGSDGLLWGDTEYGRLRRHLARFIAKQVRKELKRSKFITLA